MKSNSIHACLCAATVMAVLACVMPRPSEAQGAEIVTIGAGLAQASGTIDDIANKAGNEANYVVFSAAAELRVLIENLRLSAHGVLDKGFSEFNNSQQQVFDNIQASIKRLSLALHQPIEQARQTVEQVHEIVNGAPIFGEKRVTVIRSSPSVIAPIARAEIPFVVRGLSLDKGQPRLFFGNVEAKRIELVQQQAVFSVPSRVFKHAPDSATAHSGRLVVLIEDCTLWVFCKDVEREFRVAVMALPTEVAKVSVSFSAKNEERVYRAPDFKKNFGFSTGDLTREKCTKETQGPHAPGYLIDTEAFSAGRTHGKARNHYEILGKTPGGFTVEMCAQAQVRHLKKRSGEITVLVSWREYQMKEITTPFKSFQSANLNWTGTFAEMLPPDVNAISVRLEYFDKSSSTFIGNGADRYMDVKWNPSTKQLLLTPRAPQSIAEFG